MGCYTRTFGSIERPEGPGYGSRSGTGLIGQDFGDPGACRSASCAWSVFIPACVDRCIISIIIASCVIDLGLEVEAFRRASVWEVSPRN